MATLLSGFNDPQGLDFAGSLMAGYGQQAGFAPAFGRALQAGAAASTNAAQRRALEQDEASRLQKMQLGLLEYELANREYAAKALERQQKTAKEKKDTAEEEAFIGDLPPDLQGLAKVDLKAAIGERYRSPQERFMQLPGGEVIEIGREGDPRQAYLADQRLDPGEAARLRQGEERLEFDKQKEAYDREHPNDPLVEVFDPKTGAATYVPRSQAAGQMAPPASGMRLVTNPDGTVSFEQGAGIGGLTKPTANEVDKQLLNMGAKAERLAEMQQSFKPEYLQIGERIGQQWASYKDKVGLLSPEDQATLAEFTDFKQAGYAELVKTLNEMSGQAVTEQEAKRQLKVLPNPGEGIFDGDTPTEYKRKMDNSIRWTQMARSRLAYIRSRGDLDLKDFGGIDVADMPKIANQRGRELEAEIRKQNPGADDAAIQQQVIQRLQREFGF